MRWCGANPSLWLCLVVESGKARDFLSIFAKPLSSLVLLQGFVIIVEQRSPFCHKQVLVCENLLCRVFDLLCDVHDCIAWLDSDRSPWFAQAV